MKTFKNPTLEGTPIANFFSPAKSPKVRMEGRYVATVRCHLDHSGNRRLAGPVNGHYECCGCGKFYTAEFCAEAQAIA